MTNDFKNKIILGDCLDIMRQMPDKCIDLVLTDPPYGIGDRNGTISKRRSNKNTYATTEDSEQTIIDVVIPAIRECLRVAHRVIVTPGPRHFCKYPQPDDMGVFYQPASCSMSRWGRADCQPIFYYGRDPRVGKTIQFNSFTLTERADVDWHPCPKPLNAWKKLLHKGSDGGIVLDCFSGSGTTAIACHDLGLDFICIEKDPDYHAASVKRLEEHKRQMNLF